MKKQIRQTMVALACIPTFCLAAEVHKDVTQAMNYDLPELTCNKPTLPGKGKDVVDSTGAVNRDDVDSYQLGRYKRAEKRWMKCLTKYKKGLMKDFEKLKDSASHGLTEAQAKAILTNMKTIQSAIESPEGTPNS